MLARWYGRHGRLAVTRALRGGIPHEGGLQVPVHAYLAARRRFDGAVQLGPRPGLVAPARPALPPEPSAAELAANFFGALGRWVAAGLPVVSEATHRGRMAACRACPHWDELARAGLGKCRAPGCGCTRLKHWLATETCPLGQWPE